MPNLEQKSVPSDEQIREFWEWCGARIEAFPFFLDEKETVYDIVFPDGKEQRCHNELISSLDLNNLFKYAVPKLAGNRYHIELIAHEDGNFRTIIRNLDTFEDFPNAIVNYKDPALALFWAIQEVIKNG